MPLRISECILAAWTIDALKTDTSYCTNLTNALSFADIEANPQGENAFNAVKFLLHGRCTIGYRHRIREGVMARQRAVKCVERALSMLNFLMTKLTTKALPEIPVIIMKTY